MKVYKNIKNDYDEIRIFNEETNELTSYNQDKNIGFPFGFHYTRNINEMGYKDMKECIKSLKHRKILGLEIDYNEQRESERIGYINLGVERIKRHKQINTNNFTDIIEKLKSYGMGFVDAQNVITETYLYQMEAN